MGKKTYWVSGEYIAGYSVSSGSSRCRGSEADVPIPITAYTKRASAEAGKRAALLVEWPKDAQSKYGIQASITPFRSRRKIGHE
jgi:hypothetical protein